MRRPAQEVIAASPGDLKNNRLGLLGPEQLRELQRQIDEFQPRMSRVIRRLVWLALAVTIAVVTLSFVRVILLPVALAIEAAVVGAMLYLTSDFNRFVQQLMLDREAEAVRIVKGRTSNATLRHHILYHTCRIELQSYRVLDPSLARQFKTGELYQYYVLPQSRVIIAAEGIGEKNSAFGA
jgi:hypothetical protein